MPTARAPRLWLMLAVFAAAFAVGPQTAGTSAERLIVAPRLENRVAARVNVIRRGHGLDALRESLGLAVAARLHTREMALKGYFEHKSASGTVFWRRIERNYASRGFGRWEVGENLAWNTVRATAVDIVRQWMESPSHRANILSRSWRELGLGAYRVRHARGAYGGHTVTIVTLDLGVRAR
jgi:uncharacterized protein YkwD